MKRMNHATLYLIAVCLFLLAINITLGLGLTKQSNAAMRTMIENRMLDVSNTAAAMLDGDVLKDLEAEDRDTPEYQNVYRILSTFENSIELEYIYCVRDLGDGNFVFMIDPDAVDPGEFGEHIPYTDALHQASLGTAAVDQVPYEDDWGRFYSAYSPVFDSAHRVAGIVAVDFSADWYEQQLSTQLRTILLISAASLLVACVVMILLSAYYRRRFHQMLREMNTVSEGIETLVNEATGVAGEAPRRETQHSSDDMDDMKGLSLRILSLEHQLSERIAEVQAMAYVDGLTGLANRSAYEERVDELNAQIEEGTAAFSLAVFDLDGLKAINDRQGHDKGDEAIRQLAAALQKSFPDASLFRIGGDEFVAILAGDAPELQSRAETMDRDLELLDGLSVAKGCAVLLPYSDTEFRSVFRRADQAMYEDKRAFYQTHPDRRRQR